MRSGTTWLRWLVGGGLLALLTGCSVTPPAVRVSEATLIETTDEALQVDLRIDLVNANPDPLKLELLTYTFAIGGQTVFTGWRSAEATISAYGRRTPWIPAIVRYEQVDWVEVPPSAEWSVQGTLIYVTPGQLAEILLDTGVRRPRVQFSGAGEVPLGDA